MAAADISTGAKWCPRCSRTLHVTDFHRCSRNRDGYQIWCKECRKGHKREERIQYFREFYHNNPDKYLEHTYRRRYGISLAEYRRMEDLQGGRCYICGAVCKTGRRLSVDHNHATKVVRKLLCVECNTGIGKFREDPMLLRKVIAYLEEHESLM